MFAEEPSEGDEKLYELYQKFNLRLALALDDHWRADHVTVTHHGVVVAHSSRIVTR